MVILGINGGVRLGYHDAAAALMINGETVAAVAEERLNRIKFSPGQLPQLAIKNVLDIQGITMHDVDLVVSHGITWGDVYLDILKEYLSRYFGHCPPIERVHHHEAHAASAYFASGLDEAMVVTLDGSGDGISMQLAVGRNGKLDIIEKDARTNSLGIFYSMMTQFCGFTRDADEYKLMGLAPYGDASKYNLDEVIELTDTGFHFNNDFIKTLREGEGQPTKQQAIYTDKLTDLLGPGRIPGTKITQEHMDVAAAAQQRLNDAVIHLIKQFHKKTGLRKLCFGGGVALNCAVNKNIMNLDFIDDFYVQPASSDNGISLGAAMLGTHHNGIAVKPMDHVYLGEGWSNDDILNQLKLTGVRYKELDDPAQTAAELVSQDHVVGWFQGRMEFGPRALGNRSILANPSNPDMKSTLNAKIKFRESFRPFCPSVVAEDHHKYFIGKAKKAPYMTINFDVADGVDMPAITHVDNTARVQTVDRDINPLFHEYLRNLKRITGHAVSINTSFNRNKEPIVNNPIYALSAFFGSGIDRLIIGNYLLEKH